MSTTGPDLADALGGTFDHESQSVIVWNREVPNRSLDIIRCHFTGRVSLVIHNGFPVGKTLGTLSDGREKLVAAYRAAVGG